MYMQEHVQWPLYSCNHIVMWLSALSAASHGSRYPVLAYAGSIHFRSLTILGCLLRVHVGVALVVYLPSRPLGQCLMHVCVEFTLTRVSFVGLCFPFFLGHKLCVSLELC